MYREGEKAKVETGVKEGRKGAFVRLCRLYSRNGRDFRVLARLPWRYGFSRRLGEERGKGKRECVSEESKHMLDILESFPFRVFSSSLQIRRLCLTSYT